MTDNKNLRSLWNTLRREGYTPPEFEKFASDMKDEGNLKRVYSTLKNSGYTPPEFDQFKTDMGWSAPKTVEPTKANEANKQTGSAKSEESNRAKPTKTDTASAVKPTVKVPTFEENMAKYGGEQEQWKPTPMFQTEETLGADGKKHTTATTVPGFDKEGRMAQVYRDMATGKEYDPDDTSEDNQEAISKGKKAVDRTVSYDNVESWQDNKDMFGSQIDALQKEVSTALAERGKALDAEALKSNLGDRPMGGGALVHTFNSSTVNGRYVDNEWTSLNAASQALRDSKKLIAEADQAMKEGNFEGFFAGAQRGFNNKLFDTRTWDMGITDAANATAMNEALRVADSGKPLTKAQQALLDAKAVQMATQAYFGSYVGRGYKAGEVTAESIPFMMEMCINPASKTGKTAQSMLTRYALKRFGKETLKANGKKYLASKVATRVAGDVAGSMAMAGTSGSTRVAGDAMQRINEGEDATTAFAKAFANTTIENYSEMFGEYFGPIGDVAGKYVGKGLNKIGLGKVNDFIKDVAASDVAKMVGDFEKSAKWNGMIGEYAEEVAGNIMNAAIVGDQTFDTAEGTGVFNLDQNIDTFLGVSLMGGFLSGAKTLGYRTPKYRQKQAMSSADDYASATFGNQDKWGEIRNTVAFGNDQERHDKLVEVLTSGDYTAEQKQAAMNYAKEVEKFKGMQEAERKRRADENTDPLQTDFETSYDNGRTLATAQEMNDAKNLLDYRTQKLREVAGVEEGKEDDFFHGDYVRAINGLISTNAPKEVIDAAIGYANAKAAWDGMIDGVKDDIADKTAKAHAEIDGRTNKVTGMIQPATMKVKNQDGSERQVYVVGGNVAMMDDGSMVDTANSDESVVVRDAKTGKLEMVAPSDIFKVDEGIDPEEEKENISAQISESVATDASNKIDGTLQFTVGDSYTMVGADGQQHTLNVVASVDGAGNPLPLPQGQTYVSIDGAEPVQMPMDAIQQGVEQYNLGRLADNEAQNVEQEAAIAEQEHEAARPTYNLNDEITLRDENGLPVRGSITAEENEDGEIEVFTESPINGRKVNLFSRDVLDGMLVEQNGEEVNLPTNEPINEPNGANGANMTEGTTAETTENAPETTEPVAEPAVAQRAIDRIPSEEVTDDKGNTTTVRHWEQAEPGDTYDALNEQLGNEERTKKMVKNRVASIDKSIKDVQKQMDKIDAIDDPDAAMAATEQYNALDEQKKALEEQKKYWQTVQNVPIQRQTEAQHADAERIAQEEAEKKRKIAEAEAERQAAEEQARIDRERTNGVPDVTADKASDARARGFRNVNGQVVERQEKTDGVVGRESSVKFSDKDTAKGRIKVIEAEQLQPSHIGGVRNTAFFIDEAQPKDRTDDASVQRARDIAGNINPEEITGDGSAYQFSAPTVNSRGEVIQGNNRSDALRQMWGDSGNAQSAEAYKQYLIDHAEEFGLDADAVAQMAHPVMVNEVDVDDNEAIRLGQLTAKNLESGGIERIDPVTTSRTLGGKVSNFANVLLSGGEEDASLSDLMAQNGYKAIKWLAQQGAITPTQVKSAVDSKGNLTAEAKMDLQNILKQSLFHGGVSDLPTMFDAMPAKAQKAILTTFMRDFDSTEENRILGEIQKAIEVWYNAAHAVPEFASAKNYEQAKALLEGYKYQTNMLDENVPSDIYSNFAFELAARLQGSSMRATQTLFTDFYDLVQGVGSGSLFGDAVAGEKVPVVEAIKRVYGVSLTPNPSPIERGAAEGSNNISNNQNNVENNGEERSNNVGNNAQEGNDGGQGESGDAPSGEPVAEGTTPAERGRGTEGDTGAVGNDSQRTNDIPQEVETISSEERTAMENRIVDWLSDENLTAAFGKTREEIFEEFGNELEPIAYVPAQYAHLLGSDIKDTRIYCGKGYFIDHALRNHGGADTQTNVDDIDVSKYLNIQAILDNPDSIKETYVDGKRTVVFIKKIGRYFAELTQVEENGKIVLHKSFFNQKKEPYAKNPDIRHNESSSEGGTSSISPADNTAAAISLESRGDDVNLSESKDTKSEGKKQGKSKKSADSEEKKKPVKPNKADKPTGSAESAATEDKHLVSDARMEELKKRLRDKLRGQLNMGVDPELLAIGAELAVGHIERGARKFAEYAKAMIEDIGDVVRPYLKSFYNAVRDMPEAADYAGDMTPYEEVSKFNVATIGENGEEKKPTLLETAEQISNEQTVKRNEEKVTKQQEEAEEYVKGLIGKTYYTPTNDARKVSAVGNGSVTLLDESGQPSSMEVVRFANLVKDGKWDLSTKDVMDDFYDNGINEDAVDDLDDDTAFTLYLVDVLNPTLTDTPVKQKWSNFEDSLRKISDAKLLETYDEHKDDGRVGKMIKAEMDRRKLKPQPKPKDKEENKAVQSADIDEELVNAKRSLEGKHADFKGGRNGVLITYIERVGDKGLYANGVLDGKSYHIPLRELKSKPQEQSSDTSLMSDAVPSRDEQEVRAAIGKTFIGKNGNTMFIKGVKEGGRMAYVTMTEADGTKQDMRVPVITLANALASGNWVEEEEEFHGIVTLKDGRRVQVISVTHSGEQVNATQFTKPQIERYYGVDLKDRNNLIDFKPEDIDVEATKAGSKPNKNADAQKENGKNTGKSGKNDVTLGQNNEPSLFGDLFGEVETNNTQDNGLQRTNEPRSTRKRNENSELPQGSGAANSKPVRKEGTQRTDGGAVEGGRPSGGSVQQRNGRSTGRLQGLKKNQRNNHAERGTDYAPKAVAARIEANIAAIKLMQQLMEEGREATAEEKAVLRQFSGWGGLGEAFNSTSRYRTQLQELLGAEGYEEANMSRNSAYYTPAAVIDSMWDIARALGFEDGNVLEGSAGIGNIIGLMPKDMSEKSDIHAVEIDGVTGNILKLLYPDAKVDIQGFEKTKVRNGSVALAITNVPFVTGLKVADETGDKDLSRKFRNIHDFCIAKNVRKLREGGLGIFISSSGTLDSSQKLRDWLVSEGNADVIGAFRLNNETFGGTGATSDIIIIRKRVNGKKSAHAIDVSTVTSERSAHSPETDKDVSMEYNKYFQEHPENMGGKMDFAFEHGSAFRANSRALYPSSGVDQAKRLAEWAKSFEGMAEEQGEDANSEEVNEPTYQALGEDVKEGSMFLDKNGNLCVAHFGQAVPLKVNANKVKGKSKQECFKDYLAIKDAVKAVLDYQTQNEGNDGLKKLLNDLNKAYDNFVKTYSYLNKNTAISFLKNDMDFSSIAALEDVKEYNDKNGKRQYNVEKTDIFKKRVVEKETTPSPKTVKDGVVTSIYLHGRVDVPYIAEQLGKTEEEVKAEIIEQGLGFENPLSREVEVSYEYLSGNVREKLAQAREANENGEYGKNIKALEAIVPMNIPAHLIDFSLGSSWIDPQLYYDYIKERTGIENIKLANAGGTWIAEVPSWGLNKEKNKALGVRSDMLSKVVLGHELIIAAMQNKTIRVATVEKDRLTGQTTTTVDKAATQACATKIDEIRSDFKEWARAKMQSEPELSQKIEQIYNDKFNNFVPLSIPDAFAPKRFAGQVTEMKGKEFELRPHQSKAAVRATTQNVLFAHEVGSGKTYTLITTAMEMRRLGTARKPLVVVQNATVGQFVNSAKELYPNAKILTLEEADRTAEGRKAFYAKIKYNDWDMVVIPQSTLDMIPDSEERQMNYVRSKIEEKMEVLEKMREAGVNGPELKRGENELKKLEEELNSIGTGKSAAKKEKDEKKAAIAKQNAEVKAREMLDRKVDDVENFDDMGIDAILVDEAHEYKHLGFATAMQRGVKGIDPSYSKKSQGLYLKAQAVMEKTGGKNIVFATGTPISNTAAEIWTFMRYLMPEDVMEEYGIRYFDDFVRNFGNLQQMMEFATNGKFKENNRFAGYSNLPELVRIWSGISDTVLSDDIEDLKAKIPDMEGGKAQDIYLPQTPALRSVMKYVKSELSRFEDMSGKEKKENSHIPLTMYVIAKAAAVDARLVVDDAADDPNSKTNEAVRQTLRSLEDSKEYQGTVAIFADTYQNARTGFNLYEDVRKKLIEQGVPAEQIAIIKSGMSVKKKLEIFDKVNSGEIRVVMGSTYTLGTGVNIQERLHTLIHVDAPNRPMDYTQRNGRILRQGNIHKGMGIPVRVLRFGVEDSLDVTAYQRLKTKGAIADSIMHGKQLMSNSMENRTMEEEEDVFGDITAQLSGSEYAMLKQQAEREVRKYENKKKQWESDQTYIHNQKPRLEAQKKNAEKSKAENEEALKKVEGAKDSGITIGTTHYDTMADMDEYFKEYNKKMKEIGDRMRNSYKDSREERTLAININGFDFTIKTEIEKETQSKGISLITVIHTTTSYSCPELGVESVGARNGYLKNAVEDIVNNVVTGKDQRAEIAHAENSIARADEELRTLAEREGKPFEYDKELAEAKEKLADYTEKMKAELEEKEAKYAEMDSKVEAANVEEVEDEDDVLFRDGEEEPSWEDKLNALTEVSKRKSPNGNTEAQQKSNSPSRAEAPGYMPNHSEKSDAKVAKVSDKLQKMSENMPENGYGPNEMRYMMATALDIKDSSSDRSRYTIVNVANEIPTEFRIGSHSGEPNNSRKDNAVTIVVKTENHRFKAKSDKDYVEFLYFGDKVAGNAALQRQIVDGLRHYIETGSFELMPEADRLNTSGEYRRSLDAIGSNELFRVLDEENDEELIKRLDAEPKEKVYRAMVLIDGKLYPPMATYLSKGELNDGLEIGQWVQSDEMPEKIIWKNGKAYFRLRKPDGSYVDARYNPYVHTSRSPLNDQFSSAQTRPEIVVVETEVPSSELTSGYQAEHAKDAVGEVDWKSGGVSALLPADRKRKVILSRWAKPVRIVPYSEVADRVQEMFEGVDVTFPSNVLHPELRTELEKRGFKVEETDNQGKPVELRTREGKGVVADDMLSLVNDPFAKMGAKRTERHKKGFAARERQRMADHVMALSEKLGVPVEIHYTNAGLTGKKAKAKGWFEKKSGKVVVIIGNHMSAADVEQTMLHEIVAHYGLRKLFGKQFDTFLDNVYQHSELPIRKKIATLAAKNGWDFRTATEEYLASLAEDTDFEGMEKGAYKGWWSWLKEQFLKALHSIGFKYVGPELSDNELRYVLWRSYKNLTEPGRYRSILGQAEDVAKQYELGVGNYGSNESDVNHENAAENLLFRATDDVTDIVRGLRDEYDAVIKTSGYQVQEAIQDSMLGLKTLMDIIQKHSNQTDIADWENAYMAENALSSRNKAEQDEYQRKYYKPLVAAMRELTKAGMSEEQIGDYVMTKHGIERNREMAVRAALNDVVDDKQRELMQQAWHDQKELVRGDDFTWPTWEDKQRALDEFAETDMGADLNERDYSGLTAMFATDDVEDARNQAYDMVKNVESAFDTHRLEDAIHNATDATLQKMFTSGMISRATRDSIKEMYDFYVPLRGFDETTAEEVYAYVRDERQSFNAPLKTALGRSSKADNPFAYILSMADSAILQGNKNLMKQKFLNFVLNRPSDLVSVSDMWIKKDPVTDEWVTAFPDIPADATPDEVADIVRQFNEDMQTEVDNGNTDIKRIKGKTADVPYRTLHDQMSQHQVVVKRDGKEYVLTINGNPRAAMALNGQTNPHADTKGVAAAFKRSADYVNRQLASFYTTKNPDFVASNFVRDTLYSNSMVWVKEKPRYAVRFHKNFVKFNPKKMGQLFHKFNHGTLDMTDKVESEFYHFMMNGGETGYSNLKEIEELKKQLTKDLKNSALHQTKALLDRFEIINRSVENCARFAAYMSSREEGRSVQRSVFDAKEISVNFNKKGAGGTFFGAVGQTKAGNMAAGASASCRALYVFFNAGVQGTTNILRAAKGNKGKFMTLAACYFMLGYLAPMLMGGGGDGDDDDYTKYEDLPDYVRRTNLIIPTGGKSFISLPLPIEFRTLYGMGELASNVLSGKERYTSAQLARAMGEQVTQALPINFLEGEGTGMLSPFVPSAVAPLWQAHQNKDWTGMPIYKDNEWNKKKPEWTKAFGRTNRHLVDAAKALNSATGGDEFTKGVVDMNPALVESVVQGYFGGAVTFLNKMSNSIDMATGKMGGDWRNVPIANRLVKSGNENTHHRAINREFFSYLDKLESINQREKGYISKLQSPSVSLEEKSEWEEKLNKLHASDDWQNLKVFEFLNKQVKKMNEVQKAMPEEDKELQKDIWELKSEANEVARGK